MSIRQRARNARAFTLIEIMIVAVIIGMLATLGGFAYLRQLEQARIRTARLAVKGPLRLALTSYDVENGSFPTTEQGLAALLVEPTAGPEPANWTEPYFEDKDTVIDPWGRPYQYRSPGEHKRRYDVWSRGRLLDDPADDIGNW